MNSLVFGLFLKKPNLQIVLKLSKNCLLHFALISLIFEQILFVASASAQSLPINADGTTNTQITKTASGVDQINIAAPNSKGLSHNKFTDYNVNTGGQVINNFSGYNGVASGSVAGANAITQTKIGGLVTTNPNLANGVSAKVILNEVTSGNNTKLLGYVEIAGSKADLIIANPNGITCRGCGFLSTSHLTFIAGSSNFDSNGNLGFNLKEQATPNLLVPLISVEGLGLDASNTSSTSIIASSIKLLANIYGSENTALTLKSGEGRFDHLSKEITNSNNSIASSTSPLFAIDASSLAKIQSGQIFIIATKEGVGVNMASEVLASNEVKIDANGDVYYANVTAENKVSIASSKSISSLDSNSSISAPNLTLQSGAEFKNLGNLAAYNLDILNSGSLTNLGKIEALNLNFTNIQNITNSGSIIANDKFSITAKSLSNRNLILSRGLNIFNLENLTTSENSLIYSNGNFDLKIGSLLTNLGEISSAKELTITGTAAISNSNQISSDDLLSINANELTNNFGAVIYAAGDDSEITTTNSLTNYGNISSSKNLLLSSNQIKNDGKISVKSDLGFKLLSTFNDAALENKGSIKSLAKIDIQNSSTNFNSAINNFSEILSGTILNIEASNLKNSGTLKSKGSITLNLKDLTNSSEIQSENLLTIKASGDVINEALFQSAAGITIETNSFDNALSSSLVWAEQDLKISAASVKNKNTKPKNGVISAGLVSVDGELSIKADELNNELGVITGKTTKIAALNSPNINFINTSGSLFASGSIDVDMGNEDYINEGEVTAKRVNVIANNIFNYGSLVASEFIKFNANGINGGGTIFNGYNAATPNSTNLNKNILLAAGTYIDFTAKNNIENYGTISSTTSLNLTATNGSIKNYNNAKITGGNDTATISALNGNFENLSSSALFTSNNNAIFNVKNLNNSGEISVANNLTTNITNNLSNNASALIWSNGDATFNVDNIFSNNQAAINIGKNLIIQNRSGAKNNKVENKAGGEIESLGTFTIRTKDLLNEKGAGNLTVFNRTEFEFIHKDTNNTVNPSDDVVHGGHTEGGPFFKHEGYHSKLMLNRGRFNDGYEIRIGGLTHADHRAGIDRTIYLNKENPNLVRSNLTSKGNMFIYADKITNSYSNIQSSGNLLMEGSILDNKSSQIISKVKYQCHRGSEWCDILNHGFDFDRNGNFEFNKATGSVNSYIKAGKSFLGSFVKKIDNNTIKQNTKVSEPDFVAHSTNFNKIDIYTLGETGVINLDLSSINEAINSKNSSKVKISEEDQDIIFSGTYKINLDPASSKPLIEARSQFTDVSKFFGSKYYFDQLGLDGAAVLSDIDRQNRDPAQKSRMLGDAFAESQLIINQLRTLTNDSLFLSKNITDSDQQIKELLDNSIFEINRLGLNANDIAIKGLTKDQTNSLERDIITFENTKVNGISVLAPKIYLSLATRNRLLGDESALAKNSVIFAKEDLTINSPSAALSNNGSIVSGGNLTLDVASLTSASNSFFGLTDGSDSFAKIKSGGDLAIISNSTSPNIFGITLKNSLLNSDGSIFMSSNSSINNSNATIKASNDVVMDAGQNINNIHTTASNNKTIIEAGNAVYLNAGNDINNIGATIKGGDLVYLTAENDINNKALVDYKINGKSTNSDGSAITEAQALASDARHISSNLVSRGNIESDGNLVIIAANDINNKGSNIEAAGAAYLEATTGNINITTAALRDKTFAEGGRKKRRWVKTTDNINNIESTITSGATIDLVASATNALESAAANEIGNINITGAKLTSFDNLTISAKNDINIQSAQDKTYSYSAGRVGRGKSYLNRSSSTTQIESELNTTNNGNISIISGAENTNKIGTNGAKGSIAIVASKLKTQDSDADASNNTGNGNITLTAKEDLLIASALNTKYSESHSTKKGITIKKSFTQIDGSTTNVSSELKAAGDISTISGNDTNIIASSLVSEGSGSIISGGETNILNGVDTTTHYSNVVKEQKGILASSLMIKAFMITSGNFLNGISGGNLDKGDAIHGNSKDRVDGNATTEKIITSNLNFANNLSINSNSDLTITSSNLTSASDDIALTSNLGNVSITAATANNTNSWRANNKNTRLKATEEKINNLGIATSSEISAGKNLTITSAEGNVVLQAAKLNSGTSNIDGSQDLTINATNGNIYLLTANNSSETTNTENKKGTYSFSNGTSGHISNTIINNEIRTDGGKASENSGKLTFNTNNSILAQYKNTENGTDTSVFADSATLSYLNNLDPTKTIYNPIDETHINWDQTTRGLTKTGTAVVAVAAVIAVVATAGAAAPAMSGAATAAFAAGTASASAAAATASVSATNASMNTNGDAFKQLKDVGKITWDNTTSRESFENYAIASMTAALTAGISEISGLNEAVKAANAANSAGNSTSMATQMKIALAESAISNTTSTLVQSAVSNNSSSDTLKNLAVNVAVGSVGNLGAKAIGSAAHAEKITKSEQLTLHAGLGAAVATASGNDALSGAAAGVVGEIMGDNLKSQVDSGSMHRQTAIQLAGLSGSAASLVASAATGQSDEQTADNIFAGQRIGSNAAANNAISAQAHKVQINKELQSDSHHFSWLIVPEDQDTWKNHPDFKNNITADGKVYATIGGGPDSPLSDFIADFGLPNLHSGINRQPYDVDLTIKTFTTQINQLVIGDENLKIQQLLNLNKNFEANPDKPNYWFFPKKNDNFYNSNSYFTGIGKAAGIPIPQINFQAPGYDKPLPPNYFY